MQPDHTIRGTARESAVENTKPALHAAGHQSPHLELLGTRPPLAPTRSIVQPGRLCFACQRMLEKLQAYYRTSPLETDVLWRTSGDSIRSSHYNPNECHLCVLAMACLGDVITRDTIDVGILKWIIWGPSPEKMVFPCDISGTSQSRDGMLSIEPRQAQKFQCEVPFESLGRGTCSDFSSETLKGWIQYCDEFHTQTCRKPSLLDFVPDRLLEIVTGRQGPRVRLISSHESQAKRIIYTTMSYCWGSHLPARLLKDTAQALEQCRSVSEFPRLFQDAFLVTLGMGLRHIWIDSLCILQDSKQDWLQQSAQMHLIYSHAYVNIAAAGASDCRGTLFASREPAMLLPFEFELPTELETASRTAMAIQQPADAAFKAHVLRSPVALRGWTLQEMVLAPRTVFFAKDQLYWRCCNGLSLERCPKQVHSDTSLGPLTASMTQDEALWRWHVLMHEYMKRDLSHASDKSVAIAGLAQVLQLHMRWEEKDYLAGLWRQDLPFNLVWKVLSVRVNPSRAPSWSFLRYDGGLLLMSAKGPDDVKTPLIRIITTSMIPVGTSYFGQLVGGSIRLSGQLVCRDRHKSMVLDGKMHRDSGSYFDDYVVPEGVLYYLPCSNILQYGDPTNLRVHGLILIPTSERGQYERVGTFKFYPPSEIDSQSWVEEFAAENPGGLDATCYQEMEVRDGIRYYTITLV